MPRGQRDSSALDSVTRRGQRCYTARYQWGSLIEDLELDGEPGAAALGVKGNGGTGPRVLEGMLGTEAVPRRTKAWAPLSGPGGDLRSSQSSCRGGCPSFSIPFTVGRERRIHSIWPSFMCLHGRQGEHTEGQARLPTLNSQSL